MGERILKLELYQPFAQYRNPFTFYYAQTYPLPPVSTVMGLFQRVLSEEWGLSRRGVYYLPRTEKDAGEMGVDWEWVKGFWGLELSIHGVFSGLFWNYQQMIKAKKMELVKIGERVDILVENDKNEGGMALPLYSGKLRAQRTPVKQQELFNGYLVILVRGERSVLKDLKKGLYERPRFVIRLGRSEDVVFVLSAREVEPEGEWKKKYFRTTLGTYLRRGALDMNYAPYYMALSHWFKNGERQVRGMWELGEETEREAVFDTLAYVPAGSMVRLKKRVWVQRIYLEAMPVPLSYLLVPEVGWYGIRVESEGE